MENEPIEEKSVEPAKEKEILNADNWVEMPPNGLPLINIQGEISVAKLNKSELNSELQKHAGQPEVKFYFSQNGVLLRVEAEYDADLRDRERRDRIPPYNVRAFVAPATDENQAGLKELGYEHTTLWVPFGTDSAPIAAKPNEIVGRWNTGGSWGAGYNVSEEEVSKWDRLLSIAAEEEDEKNRKRNEEEGLASSYDPDMFNPESDRYYRRQWQETGEQIRNQRKEQKEKQEKMAEDEAKSNI